MPDSDEANTVATTDGHDDKPPTLLERLFAYRPNPDRRQTNRSNATSPAPSEVAEGSGERATQKPSPAVPTGPTGPTTKWSVDRIDSREKRFGYAAAAGSLIFALMIYFVEANNKSFHPVKNQFSPLTSLIVGAVAAAALAGSTYLGRRALLGFVSLFTGFIFMNAGGLFLALPFLLLAGMLLWRSYKTQKKAADEAKTSGVAPRPSAADRRTARAEAGRGKTKAPTGPEANKRYTPKQPTRPTPPPPKPSWIERRAATEADE